MKDNNNYQEDEEDIENIDESSGENPEYPFDASKIDIEIKSLSVDLLTKRLKGNRIDLYTEFQRKGDLWDDPKQSRLIESLMIRIPLPNFYFDGSDDDKWLIVDGLQRLSTLKNFILDEKLKLTGLEYLTQYEGKKFSELPAFLQSRIEEGQITAFVIKPGTPSELKFNIFRRINTGGLVLTSQEIRHALHSGEISNFVKSLAESKEFINAFGDSYKKIKIDRMEDREYVNRFISYYLLFEQYKPDLDSFLNSGLAELKKKKKADFEAIEINFLCAMKLSTEIFESYNFRRIENKDEHRKPVNKAIFETVSVNFAWLTDNERSRLKANKEKFLNAFIELNNQADFIVSVKTATGAKQSINTRFNKLKEIIRIAIK